MSMAGSTSADDCHEQLAGMNCWLIKTGTSSTSLGSLENSQSFEDVYKTCFFDPGCSAVKCKREAEAVSCSIGNIDGESVNRHVCLYPKSETAV